MTPIPTAGRGRYPGPAGLPSLGSVAGVMAAGTRLPSVAGGTHETARASSI